MSIRGFVVSLFAAALLLVIPSSALAAPQLAMPNGPALNQFGDVYLGGSTSRTLTIESIGTDPVEISSFSVFLPAPGGPDFTVTGDTCIGESLSTGETCTVTLKFTPSATGARNTSIFVNTTTPTADNAFGVQGNGIDPGIDVDPFNHNFGSVEVGEYGTAKTFTIENDGASELTTSLSITGTDADEFFIANQPDCNTIAPSSTCEVTVNLRPLGDAGARSAGLRIENNTSEENPITVLLSATATKALLSTDPAAVAFGSVDPYTSQAPNQTVTLTNEGNANLKIIDMDIHEGQANSFLLDPDQCVDNLVIEPGEDCSLSVTFKADSVNSGDHDSAVSIYTNVGSSAVPISATLVEGDISASAESVDVGTVEVGQSGTAVLNLYSTGTAPLVFSPETPSVSGPSAEMFDVDLPINCSGLVNNGMSCQVVVTFTPTSVAGKSATARFEGNFGTLDVSLQGQGVFAFLNVPVDGITFEEIVVGTESTQTVSLLSNGDAGFNLGSLSFEGGDAAVFSAEPPASGCVDLVRGEECPITVTFQPTAVGFRQSVLKISGNLEGGAQNVPVFGSARALFPPKVALTLSGASKVKPGKTLVLKAKLTNKGEIAAKNVTVRTAIPKKLAKTVKPIKVASIAPGKSVTKTIRVKVKKSAKKGKKLKVKVTAAGKGFKAASAARTVKVS